MGVVKTTVGDCDGGCEHQEIRVRHATHLIPADTKVLLPCEVCGVTALDTLTWTDYTLAENEKAFARYLAANNVALFHWSPSSRRNQITRRGLVPNQRPVTHAGDGTGWRAGYTCFADTPSWAWALSGQQSSAPSGEWDLWQTSMDRLTSVHVMPADWGNGIHEVRTEARVFKRDLWLVAQRVKP